MSKLIQIWSALLTIAPTIIAIIKAIEVPGNGVAKLETVTGIVLAGFDLLDNEIKKLIPVETIKAFITKVSEIVVKLFNLVGLFKKDPA